MWNQKTLHLLIFWWSVFGIVAPRSVSAHPGHFTQAHLVIREDGRFSITLNLDLLALAANLPAAQATNESIKPLLEIPREDLARRLEEAGTRLRREVILKTDRGTAEITEWKVPDLAAVTTALQPRNGFPTQLPWLGEITGSGHLPPGSETISLRVAFIVGKIVVVIAPPHAEVYGEPVEAGQFSSSLPIELRAESKIGDEDKKANDPGPGRWVLFGRYVVIGFEHIIPLGLDHILFVVGLFLLGSRLRPLLWQVSAFTIAHSITLGLSLYGIFSLPPGIVEPVIAASIAYIAIENIMTGELKVWRPVVVFFFGLIHGLGFAGALSEVGLPRQAYFLGLVGFNVGVECGQLAVILGAFLAVGWFRNRPWYRKLIVIPVSLGIAMVALFWTVQRIWF